MLTHVFLQKNYLYDKELHEKILKDLDSPVDCPICSASIEQRRYLNLHFDKGKRSKTGRLKTRFVQKPDNWESGFGDILELV